MFAERKTERRPSLEAAEERTLTNSLDRILRVSLLLRTSMTKREWRKAFQTTRTRRKRRRVNPDMLRLAEER